MNGPDHEVAEMGVWVKNTRGKAASMVNGGGIETFPRRAGEATGRPSLAGGGGRKMAVFGEYCACSAADHGGLLKH